MGILQKKCHLGQGWQKASIRRLTIMILFSTLPRTITIFCLLRNLPYQLWNVTTSDQIRSCQTSADLVSFTAIVWARHVMLPGERTLHDEPKWRLRRRLQLTLPFYTALLSLAPWPKGEVEEPEITILSYFTLQFVKNWTKVLFQLFCRATFLRTGINTISVVSNGSIMNFCIWLKQKTNWGMRLSNVEVLKTTIARPEVNAIFIQSVFSSNDGNWEPSHGPPVMLANDLSVIRLTTEHHR